MSVAVFRHPHGVLTDIDVAHIVGHYNDSSAEYYGLSFGLKLTFGGRLND
jgi:hypothetical protein